jgi:hypothetical protein
MGLDATLSGTLSCQYHGREFYREMSTLSSYDTMRVLGLCGSWGYAGLGGMGVLAYLILYFADTTLTTLSHGPLFMVSFLY